MPEKISMQKAYDQLIGELSATNTALKILMHKYEKLQADFDEHRHRFGETHITMGRLSGNPVIHITPFEGKQYK